MTNTELAEETGYTSLSELRESVYYLRVGGMSPNEIASRFSITVSRVWRLTNDYQNEMAVEVTDNDRAKALAMENDRLDALLNAVWPMAMIGDTRAVDTALKISARRGKIMGMDQVPTTEISITTNTLVTGTKEDFIASLELGRSGEPENGTEEAEIVIEEDE